MLMSNNQQQEKPRPKHYRLYCPEKISDHSGNGYDKFWGIHYKCESNVIEHLIKLGAVYEWYQIVDARDNMKVVNEQAPTGDFDEF